MSGAVARRPARKADMDRAVKVVTDAGYKVAAIEVAADGSFKVLTGESQRDELQAWRERRDARRAAG